MAEVEDDAQMLEVQSWMWSRENGFYYKDLSPNAGAGVDCARAVHATAEREGSGDGLVESMNPELTPGENLSLAPSLQQQPGE